MKLREIRLTNFKRFTDTTVTGIPETARLVILAGPNGCGKSSLIDGVHTWYRHSWARSGNWDETYHVKQISEPQRAWNNSVSLNFYDPQPAGDADRKKAVYVRSAYRNDPQFRLDNLTPVSPAIDEHRISHLIENDMTVGQNYRRLVSQGFEDAYERADASLTIGEFRERAIGEIRDVMNRLFPGLVLNSLGNPLSSGTFRFDKGDSKGFLYKNLSGGEKAAFDLLLDMLVKRREFDNTVYFIDEPEAHMSPSLQNRLLAELMKALPENCQLWLATHSLQLMRRARELAGADSGSVVFIDFDGVDFDVPTMLRPVSPNRPFWQRAMQIALDDLAGYVAPERVVLCEGGLLQGGSNFDAECYNSIFGEAYPNVVFLGAGNASEVQNDPRGVGKLLKALAQDVQITRLIDRDDRTNEEIEELQSQGVRVLSLRTIESYLLDDSVLTAFCELHNNQGATGELIEAKKSAIEQSIRKGGAADDLKRAAGDIYVAVRRLFQGTKLGSDTQAFLKGRLAPLIKNGTSMYELLRRDVFAD